MQQLAYRVRNKIRREVAAAQLRYKFSHFANPQMRKVLSSDYWKPDEHRDIHGWLTRDERRIIYGLGRFMPGPILEIGSWAGLSTTAIARGIADSGEHKDFETIDLNPLVADFRPYAEGIGFFPNGTPTPFGVTTFEAFEAMKPVLEYPGGVVGLLRDNLIKTGLSDLVKVHVGDFKKLPPKTYPVVFCDALHDLPEIANNAPGLVGFLDRGSILACHDVGKDPELITALDGIVPVRTSAVIDSLYIAEIK